jgi:dethiobiotin synthetase
MTLFISGTNTDCGKTTVTGLLARYIEDQNHSVVTQKWIQTGADSLALDIDTHYAIMGVDSERFAAYKKAICPYSFPLASSPHLAAEQVNETIDPNRITSAYSALKKAFDYVLVEGSGGVMVPMSRHATMADIQAQCELPTLLVVKNTLGCINHALLSLSYLADQKIPVLGTVFTRTESEEDSLILDDNPRVVSELSGVRCFGELPFDTDVTRLYQASIPLWESVFQSIKSSL